MQAAAEAVAAAAAAREARARQQLAAEQTDLSAMSAADRENPDKLTGEALRDLAHRRGIARSESARMTDEKLRMQLRYIVHRQYADESA